MKIIIDEKTCLKHGLTLVEFFFALAIRSSDSPEGELLNMENREIIIKDRDVYKITQHWSDVIDEIISDSSGTIEKTDEELLELAKQMREIYPQGKMKNRYGQLTPYYYRCNNGEVVKKLKKFFSIYGDVSNEDILDATRRYVASFQGNYTNMRLIKYFILKDDVRPTEDGNHVEQISDLATFLENKGEEEDEVINGDILAQLV
jgi:hypothetical protein